MGYESLFTKDAVMGFQVAGAVSSAIGAWGSAQVLKANMRGQAALADAQKAVGEFNADIADGNARLAELSAQSTLLTGGRAVSNQGLKTGMLKSSQRATMAANGLDISETSGTTQDIVNSTDIMGDIDANAIESAAISRAWGYRIEATNYTNQARMNRAGASMTGVQANGLRSGADAVSPIMSGATSLLSSAGSVASSWAYWNRPTANGASNA